MEVTLIFPHQLFRPHPAVQAGRRIWLVEDPLFFGTDRHWPLRLHWQKLLLLRAALREFADELRAAGHEPEYVKCPAGPSTTMEVLSAILPVEVKALHVVDPVDDVLARRLQRWTREKGVTLLLLPTPNFVTPDSILADHFGGERKPFMARFYQGQRQRLQLLLEADGSPQGGRWSFDTENRRKLPARDEVPEPAPVAETGWMQEVKKTLVDDFPSTRGEPGVGRYPATRRAARTWLDDFLTWRLHSFGPFEDAISVRHPVIYHSVLTPALNIGLLDPAKVVARAIAVGEDQRVPLASLEGFVRQVIGWREFMRGAYVHRGVAQRNGNFWNFSRRLPRAFYTGTTGIDPVDHVIRRVLVSGYCHHIERLMVLGNFLLLCRVHPDDVYRWFMEMFIDAYDWVMVPNVYGMSQFSDGGTFTTKPYLSASNYLLKMSDFTRGPWCEIWDALFWTFVADHREVFHGNSRLQTLTLGLERRNPRLAEDRRIAENYLGQLV